MSLDRIYFKERKNTYFLDCTRLDNSARLVSRKEPNENESVKRQIEQLSENLKAKGKTEIILVDDVVFSGNVLRTLIAAFKQNAIQVIGIRACLSTEKSYEYFNQNLKNGLKCGALMGKDVIDQICERDFYFGIAQSGISTLKQDGTILKSPYFKPYGDPVSRASIPKQYESFFSNGCLLRSIFLWKCIEDNSKKKIYIKDMPEEILNTNKNDRVIDILRKGLIYDEKDTNRNYGECR